MGYRTLTLSLIFAASELGAGSLERRDFFSPSLNRSWNYHIYLPPNYDENAAQSYPVLYFLHGMFNSSGHFDRHNFDRILTKAIEQGKIAPMVVVFPTGGRYSWWVNSPAQGSMQDAFVLDLIPHIEATYRVGTQASQRAIGGISMGGFGALHLALANPSLFASLTLFSPALYYPSPLNEVVHPQAHATNWVHSVVIRNILRRNIFTNPTVSKDFDEALYLTQFYPQRWVEQPNLLRTMPITLFFGNTDPVTDSGTRHFADFAQAKGLNITTKIFDGAHTWGLWQEMFTDLLEHIELFPS